MMVGDMARRMTKEMGGDRRPSPRLHGSPSKSSELPPFRRPLRKTGRTGSDCCVSERLDSDWFVIAMLTRLHTLTGRLLCEAASETEAGPIRAELERRLLAGKQYDRVMAQADLKAATLLPPEFQEVLSAVRVALLAGRTTSSARNVHTVDMSPTRQTPPDSLTLGSRVLACRCEIFWMVLHPCRHGQVESPRLPKRRQAACGPGHHPDSSYRCDLG
jgi:hypothetical protein